VEPAREVLEALRRAEAAVRSADNGEVGLVRIAFAGLSTTRSSPGSPGPPRPPAAAGAGERLRPRRRPGGPDTQTALALVSAEVGCHLTLASVAENAVDPHVVFVPLDGSIPDVHLRAAWRRNDRSPALRAVLDELFASTHPR
jgi:DNA-binding transcriptional LysR family regulator